MINETNCATFQSNCTAIIQQKIHTNLLQLMIKINVKKLISTNLTKTFFLVKKLQAMKETLKVNLETNCQQQKVVQGRIYGL